jgi:hypothetical protein
MVKNDETTCREFADWIACRHAPDARVDDFVVPDATERSTKAVDARFRVGHERYVVEHTILQTFQMQRYEDAGFERVVWPLEGESLGPYTLVAHGTATDYKRVKDIEDIAACQHAIRNWIANVAANLRPGVPCTASPPGVGFPVTLCRNVHTARRTLTVGRPSADPDLRELERTVVVRKALDTKLGKLQRAATNENAHSVLLLEGADPAQAGPWLIAASVANELGAYPWNPDLIYLIETHFDPHYLTALKHGPQIYSEPWVSGPINLKEGWPLLLL